MGRKVTNGDGDEEDKGEGKRKEEVKVIDDTISFEVSKREKGEEREGERTDPHTKARMEGRDCNRMSPFEGEGRGRGRITKPKVLQSPST